MLDEATSPARLDAKPDQPFTHVGIGDAIVVRLIVLVLFRSSAPRLGRERDARITEQASKYTRGDRRFAYCSLPMFLDFR